MSSRLDGFPKQDLPVSQPSTAYFSDELAFSNYKDKTNLLGRFNVSRVTVVRLNDAALFLHRTNLIRGQIWSVDWIPGLSRVNVNGVIRSGSVVIRIRHGLREDPLLPVRVGVDLVLSGEFFIIWIGHSLRQLAKSLVRMGEMGLFQKTLWVRKLNYGKSFTTHFCNKM